ncbi:MAG: hypothetical protein HFK00_05850 [Oscillospiraceae bacterium]|nr:hypothetical protein [Oscillospiraceae bacterium]
MESKNISAQINVEFTESTTRKNIESGEEIKTLFGKIKKFFSDLKTVAFTGSYNDLTNKPLYAASASAGGTATKALGDKNGSDIAETYFKNKGGTVSGAMTVANQNANVFEIQRTATIYNAVAIKFSLTDGSSIVNVGTAGFTPQKRFQVKHGDYTLTAPPKTGTIALTSDVNSCIKASNSGKLLYSGEISSASGTVSIENLSAYNALLICTDGVGISGIAGGLSGLLPVAYLKTGGSIKLFGTIPSSASAANNITYITEAAGYITAAIPADTPESLNIAQSVGKIGKVKIYSIV